MNKVRYIAITDIQPPDWRPFLEIDDVESLIRLLLYTDSIELEGIIPCTSVYKKKISKKDIEIVHKIISAYGKVKPNLDRNAEGYPEAEYLQSIVKMGIPRYGKKYGKGFAEETYCHNEGVEQITHAVDKEDERELWIGLWGGANTLAQAIWQVWKQRSPKEFDYFLSKLRIYGISDQDEASKWLREQFGEKLFYIVSPSEGTIRGNGKTFCHATWPGISCDHFAHGSQDGIHGGGFKGADDTIISEAWLEKNIRIGIYGKNYPLPVFCMEGDTPSYLGLIKNGLNVPEHPEYGGWGGRYQKHDGIWTDTRDTVKGRDDKVYCSPQSTIWRWREAFQHDFAARMEWTLEDQNICTVHSPIVKVTCEDHMMISPGNTLKISAADSFDRDGRKLNYRWYFYPEAGDYHGVAILHGQTNEKVTIEIPEEETEKGYLHLILEVSNVAEKYMTSYKRIYLKVC